MLRTLLTKEIKVFHSRSEVGLAYMVDGIFGRKKRYIFSAGYFGCRQHGSAELQINRQFCDVPDCHGVSIRSSDPKYPRVFVFASYDWCSTCSVKNIANFAGFRLNADRKK